MDINLGYIEGISYIDTPYFSSITAQSDYFDNHLVKVINTTYYPPHYRNRIRFDIEDIDLTTQVNYLWFEYGSKVYYYFINSIDYINENIIELDISMDVIQTFMFEIKISNGVIERKFINRFDGEYINRKYIRENVSSGLFTKQKTTFIEDKLWLIIKISKIDHPNTNGYNILTNVGINNKDAYVPYGYLYLPLFCEILSVQGRYVDDHWEYLDWDFNFNDIIELLKDSNTIDAYIIDFNPRPDILTVVGNKLVVSDNYIDLSGQTPLYSENTNFILRADCNSFLVCSGFDIGVLCKFYSMNSSYNIDEFDDNVLREESNSKYNHFDKKYMTQLMDENYIRIEFGNGGGVATYPLFANDNNYIRLRQYYNIDDGSKIFTIDRGVDSLYTGLDYQTYVLSNIKPSLPLLNDAWEKYQANNQGRWISAGIGTVKNAITSFAGIPAKNAYINNRIKTLMSDPNRFDKRYNDLTLKQSYSRRIDDLNIRKHEIKNDIGLGIIDSISPLIGQAINDYNAQLAPDTIRMGGDFLTSLLSSQVITMYRHLEVNDIDQVANYYHRNGFKVDEYVNEIDNLFQYVNTRYYFNIIKMSDCNIHFRDYIENEELITEVKNRLNDGIRLWNVEKDNVIIGDFTYDNVELDNLNE